MSWKIVGLLLLGASTMFGAALCFDQEPSLDPGMSSAEALPWAQREALAREILASAQASGPSDSTSLALVLYRAAGAWAPFDTPHAISLYQDSFRWVRGANIKVRAPLETAILNELLSLSPSGVTGMVTEAEQEAQNHVFASLIIYWLYQGDYHEAVEAFDIALSRGISPKDGVVLALLTTLSSRSSVDDRSHVFDEVIHYCRAHPDHYDALASWVDRLYAEMPPPLVRDAAHTVLAEAEMDDWQHPWGGIAFGGGSIGTIKFRSHYELELFRIGPALQSVDAPRSEELISENASVAEALKKYPNGFRSLAPNDYWFSYVVVPSRTKSADLNVWSNPSDPLNLSSLDLGLEFNRTPPLAEYADGGDWYQPNAAEARIVEQLRICPPDVLEQLTKLAPSFPIQRKVPFTCEGPPVRLAGKTERAENRSPAMQSTAMWCSYTDTYPRVDLLESVANGCINAGNAARSRAALHDLDDVLGGIPEHMRVDFIAEEADYYLRLGDSRAAADVVDEGFQLAASVYDREAKSASLKEFPASLWDAAEIYRRMVTLGVYASVGRTQTRVNGITDASLRAIEEVMIARALLGVPVRRTIEISASGQVQSNEGYSYAGSFSR